MGSRCWKEEYRGEGRGVWVRGTRGGGGEGGVLVGEGPVKERDGRFGGRGNGGAVGRGNWRERGERGGRSWRRDDGGGRRRGCEGRE